MKLQPAVGWLGLAQRLETGETASLALLEGQKNLGISTSKTH